VTLFNTGVQSYRLALTMRLLAETNSSANVTDAAPEEIRFCSGKGVDCGVKPGDVAHIDIAGNETKTITFRS